jgi:hypothetical protein
MRSGGGAVDGVWPVQRLRRWLDGGEEDAPVVGLLVATVAWGSDPFSVVC